MTWFVCKLRTICTIHTYLQHTTPEGVVIFSLSLHLLRPGSPEWSALLGEFWLLFIGVRKWVRRKFVGVRSYSVDQWNQQKTQGHDIGGPIISMPRGGVGQCVMALILHIRVGEGPGTCPQVGVYICIHMTYSYNRQKYQFVLNDLRYKSDVTVTRVFFSFW